MNILDYDYVRTMRITIDENEYVDFSSEYYTTSYASNNKMAVFDFDCDTGRRLLGRRTSHGKIYPPVKVFISPDCKVPRALIRNSGFQIVMSEDKAEYIVMPSTIDEKKGHYERLCNLVVRISKEKTTTNLFLIDVSRTWTVDKTGLLDTDWEAIKNKFDKYIERNYGSDYKIEYFHRLKEKLDDFNVYCIPNCEVYRELLSGTNIRSCVFDFQLALTPTNTIDAETIDIWSKIDDRKMLEKYIIGSNYMDYPLTVCWFIENEKNFLKYGAQEPFKKVLRDIHYEQYADSYYEYPLEVTPADWNLLQGILLKRRGLGEKGGVVEVNTKCLLKEGRAFKPFYITQPMTIKQIFDIRQ